MLILAKALKRDLKHVWLNIFQPFPAKMCDYLSMYSELWSSIVNLSLNVWPTAEQGAILPLKIHNESHYFRTFRVIKPREKLLWLTRTNARLCFRLVLTFVLFKSANTDWINVKMGINRSKVKPQTLKRRISLKVWSENGENPWFSCLQKFVFKLGRISLFS